MATRVSRRKLAKYCGDQIIADSEFISKLAAYLIESGRVHELDLVVRDIEEYLTDRGLVVADVASAKSLSEDTRKAIKKFLGASYDAKQVELRESIDEALIGGVKIDTPDSQYDGTVRRKLNNIKASKV